MSEVKEKTGFEKSKALYSYILEECKRQDFTIHDFDKMVWNLVRVVSERRTACDEELFYAREFEFFKHFF